MGHSVSDGIIFDTIKVAAGTIRDDILRRAEEKKINIRQFDNGEARATIEIHFLYVLCSLVYHLTRLSVLMISVTFYTYLVVMIVR